jgi:hypothetical protein
MLESLKLIVVVLGIGLVVSSEASERLGIPAGSEAPSSRVFIAQRREFHRRMVIGAFDAVGQRDDRWSKPARQFLELWIEWTDDEDPTKALAELKSAGKAAIEAGCDDPMVHCLYGRVLEQTERPEEWLPYFQKANEGFAATKYGVLYRLWAAHDCQLAYEQLGQLDLAAPYKSSTTELLLKTLSSDDYRPDEQRVLLAHVLGVWDAIPFSEKRQLFTVVQDLPGVHPWLRNTMNGKFEIDLAWAERGGGWANEVNNESWKGFAEHLQKAYERLFAAWQSDPHAPEPAAELINVANAGGTPPDQGPRYWFERAVSAEYDFLRAYRLYRDALLPRWGGSVEELHAFACECLATKRYDSRVPFEYFEIVNTIATDFQGDPEFFEQPGVFDNLVQMNEGYLIQSEASGKQNWCRSFAAAVAWRCKRWEEGRRFIDQMGGPPDEEAFSRLGVTPEMALGEIDARSSGEWSPKLSEAEAFYRGGQFASAANTYRTLLAALPANRPAAGFLKDGLRNADLLQRFHNGEWVDITPDLRGSQWKPVAGEWTIDNQGWLTGVPNWNGMSLMCELKFGRRVEFRGDARFGTASVIGDNFGVFFGPKAMGPRNSFNLHLPQHACIWEGSQRLAVNDAAILRDNQFHIQRWDNEVSTSLNGSPIQFAVQFNSEDDDETALVGVGGHYRRPNAAIQFRNLQVRLLKERPRRPENLSDSGAAAEPLPWYRVASVRRSIRYASLAAMLPVLGIVLIVLIRRRNRRSTQSPL